MGGESISFQMTKVIESRRPGLDSVEGSVCEWEFTSAYNDLQLIYFLSSIGDTAKQSAHARPSQTIFDVKRLLGRCYDSELYEDIRHWPFKVVNNYGRPAVEVLVQGREKIFVRLDIGG